MASLIGARFGAARDALRTEDGPLLTGRGRFTDDLAVHGEAHAAFVRAPVAHAEVRSVDVTSADMLAELDNILQLAGIELCFAGMKDPVKDKLKRFGLFPRLGEEAFFPTIGSAVSRYIESHTVEWEDWEDRTP